MFILGIDLEGMNGPNFLQTGIDHSTDRVTEIGAVLWDWKEKTPVEMLSRLTDEPDRLPISEENTALTGITDRILNAFGARQIEEDSVNVTHARDIRETLRELSELMMRADYIMAHNGGSHLRPNKGYDFQMIKAMFKRFGFYMPETPWIDSLFDVEYPEQMAKGGRNLTMLAANHGFLNPFPHRAVTDVLTMLKVVADYDLERMIILSQSPMVEMVWKSPYPKTDEAKVIFEKQKAIAKKNRFYWNPDNKEWVAEAKQIHVDEGMYEEVLKELTISVRPVAIPVDESESAF